MDLLSTLHNCSEHQLDSIIEEALNKAIIDSDKKEFLGFKKYKNFIASHKGLIAPDTRIRYCNMSMNHYSMKTTDYYYEFAKYLKEYNINNKSVLVRVLENFINGYFGINNTNKDMRDAYFNQLTWQTTTTDEEYFAKIDSLEIGDLKGKNIAMCTERAAIAQNILTLFGFETYYCMGAIDNNGQREAHCFNIVKAKNSFMLVDYSIPCPLIFMDKIIDYAPFQGKIDFNEIEDVLLNGIYKTFDSYEYVQNSNEIKKVLTGKTRIYTVGNLDIEYTKNHKL